MLDKQLLFSDAQSITGTDTTVVSTNKIKLTGGADGFTTDTLGNTLGNDPGKSPEVDILITVVTAFSGGTSVAFDVGYDNDSAFGSPTVMASSAAIAVATLVPGYQVRLSMAPGQSASDIYMGIQARTVGAVSAGAITAGLVQKGGKPTAPGVFR